MRAVYLAYCEQCLEWLPVFRSLRSIYTIPVAGKPYIRHILSSCWRMKVDSALILDRFYDERLARQLQNVGIGARIDYRPAPLMDIETLMETYADFIRNHETRLFLGPRYPRSETFSESEAPATAFATWSYAPGRPLRSVRGFDSIHFSTLKEWYDLNLRLVGEGLENPNLPGYRIENGVRYGARSVVHPSAIIEGNAILGDDTLIAPKAKLCGASIVGDHCAVGPGSVVRRSILCPGTCVQARVNLDGRVVDGDRVIDPEDGSYAKVPHAISRPFRFWSNRFLGANRLFESFGILRTHDHLTLARDERAEEVFQRNLKLLAAAILSVPSARHIRGVYLGGGYGRGEGGIAWREGKPHFYNDLDLFVVSRTICPAIRRRIDRDLAEISAAWTPIFRASVDFAPARTLGQIRRRAGSLMFQELIHGHAVLLGENVLVRLPAHSPRSLPVSEAARLLLNRGAGLLLAALRLNSGPLSEQDADFVRRNLHKAALACADAELIANGTYDWSLTVRTSRLRGNQPYQAAAAYKAAPKVDTSDTSATRWRERRDDWRRALGRVLRDRTPDEIFDESRAQNLFRHLLRLRRFCLRPPLALGLMRLERLLARPLERLLPGDPDIDRFLRHWNIFN